MVRTDSLESGQLRTFLIQVCIHANHQNGKDTHVRGLQIFSAEPYVYSGDVRVAHKTDCA